MQPVNAKKIKEAGRYLLGVAVLGIVSGVTLLNGESDFTLAGICSFIAVLFLIKACLALIYCDVYPEEKQKDSLRGGVQ